MCVCIGIECVWLLWIPWYWEEEERKKNQEINR